METLSNLQFAISSPAFIEGSNIPEKYTCDGQNINPVLEMTGIPEQTNSLALIMEDPDAPGGIFDHWVVWNIPVTHEIKEHSIPGVEGKNSFGQRQYGGPCPPGGEHRYFFKIFALNEMLSLDKNSDKMELLKAMEGHILATGSLMGTYKR